MKKFTSGRATVLFGCLLLLFATPGWSAGIQVLRSHVPAAVASMQPDGKLSGTNRLNLAIGLPLRNQAALSNLLRQIYDPASPEYHHFLTPEQFAEQFGPAESDYQAVIAFANANGLRVTATHPNRLLLDVSGPVTNLERALHVTLRTYRHPTENRTFYAPDTEPSLDLDVPVLHISGLDNYSLPRPRFVANPLVNGQDAAPNTGSGPNGYYMGGDFRAAYVPDTTLTGSGQAVGLLQFDGYTASDITYYENQAGLPNVPLQNVFVDGASGSPSGNGGEVEVSLDIEMAVSMAPGLSNVIVYMAPNPSPFVDILNRMANDNLAKQLSCSWYMPNGTAEPAADLIFQQMAAQGQSFFSASGDDDAFTGLIPFPGDTPYITEVGGTTLTTSGPGGAWVSETVWNRNNGYGSGGGISTQYAIPAWQTNVSMTANQGSTTKRNVPDVALTAENVYVRADGQNWFVGGTSCASPLWAGFAALVNQQAVASGHSPVGFINPAIYAIGAAANYASIFHDTTTGNNTSGSSPAKFYAVSGYDLCTGWGAPSGQALINALANPETLLVTPAAGFTSAGGFGGPFTITSQTFSLTNAGTNSLTWTLASTSSWLTASSAGGTLTPGGAAATVTVSLNSAASNLVVGTYNATVWFTNLNDNIGQGRQFTLSVISPPVITTQPANLAVLEGSTASFTVASTGGMPLAYQWQDNGTNLIDGGNISGSATTNLIVSNVSAADVGTYTVVVTNVAGVVTSSNALLTIIPSPPVIIMQPSSQTAIVGGTAAFSVSAIGTTPFYYQWSFNGTNIEDATSASLTLVNVQLTQAGIYAVVVTNVYGSAVSSNSTLNVYTVPVITTFSPQTGADGTVVNITGLNFDPTPGNNTVHFGAVRAVVNAASATNLVVSVPVGATYAPIAETVNGLTAYADAPFLPTFSSSSILTNSSLGSQITLPTGSGPGKVLIADFDGDGKPDLAVNCGGDHTLYVYRNISTNGTLTAGSFAPPVVLQLGTGGEEEMAAADLTGDGKLDLVFLDYNSNSVVVLQNLCTPGSITTNSFGPRVNFAVGSGPVGVAVQDLDGDGKPEIVTANLVGGTVSVLRNLGTAGVITTNSFAPAVSFAGPTSVRAVAIADLDGDGKPDVVTLNWVSGSYNSAVSVFRNVSTLGNIACAPRVDFPGLSYCYKLAIGDMDGDGKLDVVFVSFANGQSVSVYRNTSTPGSFTTNSFAPRVDFGLGGWANGVTLGDMDGDGKPDVAAVTQGSSQLSLFRNIGTPGSFTNSSLAGRLDFASGTNPYGVAIGDLDGDGKPDVVFGNNSGATVTIYQNVVPFGGPPVITAQPQSQTNGVGSIASFGVTASGTGPLSYQWSANGTIIIGATNFTLTLTNVQLSQNGNYYSVLVTNFLGSTNSIAATLTVLAYPPTITAQPLSQTNYVGTTVSFSVTAGGTTPLFYQWNFNGTNIAGATNATLTLTNVQLTNAGNYSALVANAYGSTNSAVAALTVNQQSSCDPPPSGLVGWWRAEGNANDSIGANNGTLGSGAGFTDGEVGQAFSFNGTSSSYVSIPDSPLLDSFTNSITIELWLKANQTNANTDWETVVSKGNAAWEIQATVYATTVSFYMSGPNPSNVTGNRNVQDGKWHHVAAVYDGTNIYLYVDGTLDVSTPATGSIVQNSYPMGIGYNAQGLGGSPGYFYNGMVDEVSLYHRALTASEIHAIYAAGSGGKCVTPAPPTITTQPLSQTNLVGTTASFNVTAGGTAPLFYQWNFNGTNINGATNATLTLTNVQMSQAGNYAVTITNLFGSTNSAVAVLTVLAQPPTITTQPVSQTNFVGTTVSFSVTAGGTPPLSYQWNLDGTNIAGATNTTLTLTNVQLSQSGNYSVLVTNAYGSTNSAVAVLTVNPPSSCDPPPSGLVGWWRAEGNAKDSVGTNNGTLGSGAGFANGEVGQAFNFNGTSSSYVSIPDSPLLDSFTNSITIELWLKANQTNANSNWQMVVSKGNAAWEIAATVYAKTVSFYMGGPNPSNVTGSRNVQDGKWHHVAAVYDGTNIYLYVDGTLDVSTPATGSIVQNSYPMGIGYNAQGLGGSPGYFYNGMVDEVSLYHRALTASEIQVIYAAGTGGKCPPTAPFIVTQPTNQAAVLGSTATFTVMAGGTAPLSYRWRFNGTNIAGATNTSLAIVNAQFTSAGTYSVLVTNACGFVTSSNAVLAVGTAPVITNQPVSQRVSTGCSVAFSVGAGGTGPLGYQWWRGSLILNGQINSILALTNIQTADFTNYYVVVSSSYGSVTSSNAMLSQDHPPVAVQDAIQRLATGDVKVQMSTLLANDTDPDGDTLTFLGVSSNSAAGGTVSWNGNWVYYLPPAGYTNADAFTYTISDGYCGGTATGNVLVQVVTASGPSHNFKIYIQPDGSVLLVFAGIPGWTYRIQYADTLPPVNWTDLSTNTADAQGVYQFNDARPTDAPSRFYRSVSP